MEDSNEVWGTAFDSIADDISGVFGKVKKGVKGLYSGAERVVKDKYHDLTAVVNMEKIRDIYGAVSQTVKENAGKGKEALTDGLERIMESYDVKLDSMIEKEPAVAGFIDGWVNSMVGTSTDRSRKHDYLSGVGMGKAFGWGGSVMLLYKGHIVLGSIPFIRKGAEYLNDKLEYAKQEVASR